MALALGRTAEEEPKENLHKVTQVMEFEACSTIIPHFFSLISLLDSFLREVADCFSLLDRKWRFSGEEALVIVIFDV